MDFQTRYEFDPKKDLLGKGGFSKVYKANDILLERTVALKFFTAKTSEKYQILNEIKRVIRFEHPNLCKYYDVALLNYKNVLDETEQQVRFFLLAFKRGETLHEVFNDMRRAALFLVLLLAVA